MLCVGTVPGTDPWHRPIRARAFRSRVYEYYDPEVHSVAWPVQLEVRKR